MHFQPLTEEHARTMCSWRYDPPYDIYNLDDPPDTEDLAYYLDPVNQYHAILDDAGELLAFCSFGPDGQVGGGDYSEEALDIGMGVRPDLTGQGRGASFSNAVIAFALKIYAPACLRVTIADFNKRAMRVWEKAEFQFVTRFPAIHSEREFVLFVRREP